jgi:hypothetical protein
MSNFVETTMSIGVQLRTQVVDPNGSPGEFVQRDGALRVQATNLGIISFEATMSTKVIGGSVTNLRNQDAWQVRLLLPGSSAAKTADQQDTKLKVVAPHHRVAFRTVGQVGSLVPDEDQARYDSGHYQSEPLDIFAMTL